MGWGKPVDDEGMKAVPLHKALALWNPQTQSYVELGKAAPVKKRQPTSSSGITKRKRGETPSIFAKNQNKRPKLQGLPADSPSEMFKGPPLALAMRGKAALQERFPGLSPAQLVAKKKELDARALLERAQAEEEAKDRLNGRPAPRPRGQHRISSKEGLQGFYAKVAANKPVIKRIPVSVKKV
jgi:hypothetical protein